MANSMIRRHFKTIAAAIVKITDDLERERLIIDVGHVRHPFDTIKFVK